MRLATLEDGRAALVDGDELRPLPGALVDHLCRSPHEPSRGKAIAYDVGLLDAPIPRPGKVIGVGLNYADHAREGGQEIPEKPLLFAKLPSCVVGPERAIVVPPGEVQIDYEAELAVVIGAPGRDLEPAGAARVIGGYACFNDVSDRKAQFGDGQWLRAKSFDTFGPFGPWIATPEEIADPQDLAVRCWVNGDLRQDSSTSEMVIAVTELVSYCSKAFPLEPGDVIATGTPAGVGMGRDEYLGPGDVVRIEIEGLGVLENAVAQRS